MSVPPPTSLRRSVLDPLADDVDRRRRKVGSAIGHAGADCLRALELLDEEARIRIAGDHADQIRVLRAVDGNQIARGETRIEPQPLLREWAAAAARDGAGDRKDVVLNAGERRLESGRLRAVAATAGKEAGQRRFEWPPRDDSCRCPCIWR